MGAMPAYRGCDLMFGICFCLVGDLKLSSKSFNCCYDGGFSRLAHMISYMEIYVQKINSLSIRICDFYRYYYYYFIIEMIISYQRSTLTHTQTQNIGNKQMNSKKKKKPFAHTHTRKDIKPMWKNL